MSATKRRRCQYMVPSSSRPSREGEKLVTIRRWRRMGAKRSKEEPDKQALGARSSNWRVEQRGRPFVSIAESSGASRPNPRSRSWLDVSIPCF